METGIDRNSRSMGHQHVDPVTGIIKINRIYMRNQTCAERAVGYCHSNSHRGYLTPVLIKKHGCLEKRCPYLSRYLDRPYWIEKNRNKLAKKIAKLMAKKGHKFLIVEGKKFKIEDHRKILEILKKTGVDDINSLDNRSCPKISTE